MAPDFFGRLGLPWMTDPLADQHTAGAIAWGIGEAPTLVLALMVALQWLRQDRRETERTDRQADRDHDADLTAYNAYLSGIAAQDRRRVSTGEGRRRADARMPMANPRRPARAGGGSGPCAGGADLVLLPELWAPTGFGYRGWAAAAEPLDGRRSRRSRRRP